VNDHISIAVGDGGDLRRDDDTAEDELAPRLEAVNVVTMADAMGCEIRHLDPFL
jgi:hypothetical protein